MLAQHPQSFTHSHFKTHLQNHQKKTSLTLNSLASCSGPSAPSNPPPTTTTRPSRPTSTSSSSSSWGSPSPTRTATFRPAAPTSSASGSSTSASSTPVDNVFANDSIELLRQSGIDFKKNSERGVDAARFAELLMSSGIVLNDAVHWVTFNLIKMYFPTVYDIKHLMKFCNSLHGGLNKLAELLEVERVGICCQAGSDSLLTSSTFRKLKESFFNGSTERYAGVLYGLGVESHHSSRPPCESSHSPTAAKTRLSSLSSSPDSSYLPTIHTSLSPTCSPLKSIPTGKTPPAGWTAAHGLQSCEFRASGGHWNRVQSMRNQSPDICQPWTEAVRRACDLWRRGILWQAPCCL